MTVVFNVGDVVQPIDELCRRYAYTKRPTMEEGVVEEVYGDRFYLRITKGRNSGERYRAKMEHFELAKPMSDDEAFEAYLRGSISEVKYKDIRRERG